MADLSPRELWELKVFAENAYIIKAVANLSSITLMFGKVWVTL